MNDVAIDLDNITKSLQMFHFAGELENAKKSVKATDEVDDSGVENVKISKLETILKQVSTPAVSKQVGVKELFSEVDNSVYKLQWKKLPEFHKNMKLKEYITENHPDKTTSETLEKLLIGNPIMNSDKNVTYDTELMKITAIPALKYNEETKGYTLIGYTLISLNKARKKIVHKG